MYGGRVAVVIGGAQGTGRACAEILVKRGAKVCIGDVAEDAGRALETKLNQNEAAPLVIFKPCDVRHETEIEGVFQTAISAFGQTPDIVFNMAGKIQETEWSTALDITVGGHIRCISSTIRHMSKENGGRGGVYVGMSSISGLRPEAWEPIYSACKHAVVGLCTSWGMPAHFKIHGIRFNCVCPTAIDTGFLAQVTDAYFADQMLKRQDEVEKLSPETVAEAFLLPVDDVTINGRAIRVTSLGVDFAILQDSPIQ